MLYWIMILSAVLICAAVVREYILQRKDRKR